MDSTLDKLGYPYSPRWWLPWVVAGLLVALHYHFYHRVEWGWAVWWGLKDGVIWGIIATLLCAVLDSVRVYSSRAVLGFVILGISLLGTLGHSVAVVSLSYLLEGFSTDHSFATVVGKQLIKKAPLNFTLFLAVSALVVARGQGERRQETKELPSSPNDRLLVNTLSGQTLLDLATVDRIEAEGNYVAIHSSDRRYLERKTMKETERLLSDAGFVRIHRSHLINLEHLKAIERTKAGGYSAILSDGTRLPLGRIYREKLKKRWC